MDELDNLQHLAAEVDAEATPPAPEAGGELVAAPQPTQAEELAGMMLMVGQMLAMRFPSLSKIYTPERCSMTAQAVAPALERLGWNVSGGEMTVYITAGGAVLMLGFETRMAIMADLANEKREAAASQAAQGGAPGHVVNGAETTGPAVHAQTALFTQ